MKRTLTYILTLLLSFSMLLTGCSTPPAGNDQGDGGSTTPPGNTDNTFKKTENYMPADVYAQMKTYFESKDKGFFPCTDLAKAPLVSTDVFGISNAKVKSITIPVFSTEKADKDGNFTFSLYILRNSWSTLRAEMADPDDRIEVKINAEAHGLTEYTNTVRKFIKVDLTEYNIELSDKETLGFGHAEDTLIPARVTTRGTVDELNKEKYAPAKYMIDAWDVVGYYCYDHAKDPATGKEKGFTYTGNSLFFDFELERSWESEDAYHAELAAKAQSDAEYAAKLAAVKTAYAGKCFSLIGDSISTFGGVSNDYKVHPSLELNAVNYSIKSTVYDYTKTYWGKLAVDTDMDLCVINAWSGGRAYGKVFDSAPSKNYKDNMLLRSNHLASAAGKSPDLIFLYYGTNDLFYSPSSSGDPGSARDSSDKPTGDLYQRLSAANKTKTDTQIVAEWFAEVQQKAADAGYDPNDPTTIQAGETYICWEAAYALALHNILTKYEGAEVYVITLAESNSSASKQPRLGKANTNLRAIAAYFGATVIEHSNSGITLANCHMYATDTSGVHPNGKGHALITKLIVETLYEKLQK